MKLWCPHDKMWKKFHRPLCLILKKWRGGRGWEREMPMINFPTFRNVCPEEEKLVPKFPYGSVICSFFLSLAEWVLVRPMLLGDQTNQPGQGQGNALQGHCHERRTGTRKYGSRNGITTQWLQISFISCRNLFQSRKRGECKIFQWLANLFKIQNKSQKFPVPD